MYEVDSNQELLALVRLPTNVNCISEIVFFCSFQGLSNVVGSVFSCLPVTASLSRSMIQQTVGGVTQLASVVSSVLLLTVLLWVGPVFQTLPRCVLASIIVIALKVRLVALQSMLWYSICFSGYVIAN